MNNLKSTLLLILLFFGYSLSVLAQEKFSSEITKIKATAGNGRVTITFRGFTFNETYRAYYSTNQVFSDSTPKVEINNPCKSGDCAETLISIEVNNLQNGIPYFFWLASTLRTGANGIIAESALTQMICAIPAQPTMMYVPNFNSSNVSQFKLNQSTGDITPLDNSPVAGLYMAQFMTVAGKNAYIVSPYGNKLLTYKNVNGSLVPILPNATNGNGSTGIISDNTDQSVYITDAGSQQISVYAIDAKGSLNHLEDHNCGNNPQSLTMTPDNKFLYVFNYSSNTVAAYQRDANTFRLTRIKDSQGKPSSYACGANPIYGMTDPSGKFLYVACNSNDANNNNIYKFTIGSDGTLSGMQGYTSGNTPQELIVDRTGKFLYVINVISNNIQAFSIDTMGNLSAVSNGIYATGQGPNGIAFSPKQDFIYVANSSDNSITSFNRDITTGLLSNADVIKNGVGTSPQQIIVKGKISPRAPAAGEIYKYKLTLNVSNPDANATKYIAYFKSDTTVSSTNFDRIEVFSGPKCEPSWINGATKTYVVFQAINENGVSETSPYFFLDFSLK